MNNRLRLISLSLVSGLFLVACGGEEKPGKEAVFSVSPSTADVTALGGNQSFSVLSSADWYARSDKAWIKMVVGSGKGAAEVSTLTVNVEENKETAERTGTVTVSTLDGQKADITLRQAAGGDLVTRGIGSAEDLLGFARAVNGEAGYSINQYLIDGDGPSAEVQRRRGKVHYQEYSLDGGSFEVSRRRPLRLRERGHHPPPYGR